MPKVFLVKRRSPGASVRSWDELPDDKRADTYIPGEERGGRAWARGSRVGAGWLRPSCSGPSLQLPPLPPLGRGHSGLASGERESRLGNLGPPVLSP